MTQPAYAHIGNPAVLGHAGAAASLSAPTQLVPFSPITPTLLRPPTAQVNSLTSFETELPYEYYTMPFCKPEEGVHRIANSANPGTILQGLRIENSPYKFIVKVGADVMVM